MVEILAVFAGWAVIHYVYREKLWLQRESILALEDHVKILREILKQDAAPDNPRPLGKWQS